MPAQAKTHTPATLAKIQPPANGIKRVAVGGVAGLYLQISDTNARSWIVRGQHDGKRVNRGLGSTGDLSLAQAREAAREVRAMWRDGKDPAAERHPALIQMRRDQERAVTFGAFYPAVVTKLTESLTNAKARAQWMSTLDRYAAPIIGDIPVADLTVSDVCRVLEPIWADKPDTAGKLRGRIAAILDSAIAREIRTAANPAQRPLVVAVLGKQVVASTSYPAVDWRAAPAFMADLRARNATSYAALQFLALTATRSGEVRGATWAEIDPDARVWTIPASRTKTRTQYRVPLTPAAWALLAAPDTDPYRNDPTAVLFPAPRGGAMSDAAVGKSMRTICEGRYRDPDTGDTPVPHGLRATFRTWSQEQLIDREIAEHCLAHVTGSGAEQAYKRSDQIEARRAVLQQWADYLEGRA